MRHDVVAPSRVMLEIPLVYRTYVAIIPYTLKTDLTTVVGVTFPSELGDPHFGRGLVGCKSDGRQRLDSEERKLQQMSNLTFQMHGRGHIT